MTDVHKLEAARITTPLQAVDEVLPSNNVTKSKFIPFVELLALPFFPIQFPGSMLVVLLFLPAFHRLLRDISDVNGSKSETYRCGRLIKFRAWFISHRITSHISHLSQIAIRRASLEGDTLALMVNKWKSCHNLIIYRFIGRKSKSVVQSDVRLRSFGPHSPDFVLSGLEVIFEHAC